MSQNKKGTIKNTASIRDAIKIMDIEKLNSLIVINSKKKVLGIFTMGDFRRVAFFGLDIEEKISSIINKNFIYLMGGFSKNEAKKLFTNNNLIMDIPVLNKNFELIKIISRKNFFSHKHLIAKNINLNNFQVVIMAGGKGTRLDPFTRILPKPLIPFGHNPIIRVLMDYFIKFGLKKFYISINEKANMIRAYFHDLKSLYNVKYIEEKKPLGTAGSLRLLKNRLKNTFFVTNCDVLIYAYYPAIIEFHKKNNYDLTLVSSMRSFLIPYGVCNFDKDGVLKNIKEKPSYDFFVNTGLYIIEPKVLKLIPKNVKFDMNELIIKSIDEGIKIGVFPITENSWIDVGQWPEYKKNINNLIN
jgi:dTDP-glucose pyrophosphorylase